MSLRDRIKDDYLVVDDDPEFVAYHEVIKGSPGSIWTATGFRDELTEAELGPSGGAYTRSDIAVMIAKESAAFTPKPGDTFSIAGSDTLTVLDVGGDPFQLYFRLIGRNVRVHNNLQDTLGHYRPENKADGAGGRTTALTLIVGGVACRVQERTRTPDTRHGRRVMVVSYSIWVETQLDARAQDILRASIPTDTGPVVTDYTVTGSIDPDRIDVLQEIQAERLV